jgi:hypothetical protein
MERVNSSVHHLRTVIVHVYGKETTNCVECLVCHISIVSDSDDDK